MAREKRLVLLVSAYTSVRRLYELANLLGLETLVPDARSIRDIGILCSADVVVTDAEPVIDVERFCRGREGKPVVVRINGVEDPLAVLARVAREAGIRFGEIVVGIDPGPCPAYAVVVDGRLVRGARLCKSMGEVVEMLCRLLKLFEDVVRHAEVKIGSLPGASSQAITLRNCAEMISFVDESSTSSTIARMPGAPAAKRHRDVHAAAAIALRMAAKGRRT